MKFNFSDKDFAEIEKVLGTKFGKRGNQYRAVLLNMKKQSNKYTNSLWKFMLI